MRLGLLVRVSAVVESQFVSIATPCIISRDTNFSEGLLAFGSTGLLGQRSTAGIEFGSKKAAIMASLEATILKIQWLNFLVPPI